MRRTLLFVLISLFLTSCSTGDRTAVRPVAISQDLTATATATATVTATITVTSTITLTPTITRTPFRSPTPAPPAVLPPIRTPEIREALPAKGTVTFQILHWNDFHGELVERVDSDEWVPGAARLAYFVKTQEGILGQQNTLILDAGDWFEGTPSKIKSGSQKVLEFYQRLGVDASAVGNHEFFLGPKRFYEITSKAAPMEILSVNLRRWGANKSCSDEPIVNAYKTFELGDADGPKVRVAVIGVGRQYLEVDSYATIVGICFSDPLEEILKIYDEMVTKEKPDVIVVVSHSGLDNDRVLAEKLNAAKKPVDIIIGGHGHTLMDAPEVMGKTQIVQVGDHGRYVGLFGLVYNRETRKLKINWRREAITECVPPDPDTVAFLKEDISTPAPKTGETPVVKDPNKTYLMDLPLSRSKVGWWVLGMGRFPAVDNGMVECQVITSHEKNYPYGLFAHSPSELVYNLNGQFSKFETEISIKETACGDGAEFIVTLDGKEIYHSPVMTAASAAIPISLEVSGGKELVLSTVSGDDISCDWTIWGDPYLIR